MILSASRRTDIPAFFGDDFMDRVKEGHFTWMNPFNPSQVKEVSLLPQDVDAIVFWSKDPSPFVPKLAELDARGYRYYFQFTLNDYPLLLEPNVPPVGERVDTFKRLSDLLGPRRVVWRYDPIVVSSVTSLDYHLAHVESLARALEGYSDSLVISFLDFYGRVRGRLAKLGAAGGVSFEDIAGDTPRLIPFAKDLAGIARSRSFQVSTCSEKADLAEAGIRRGACIDAARLRDVLGVDVSPRKDKGQRPECLCAQSIDIGKYHTCRHGCRYCYAI